MPPVKKIQHANDAALHERVKMAKCKRPDPSKNHITVTSELPSVPRELEPHHHIEQFLLSNVLSFKSYNLTLDQNRIYEPRDCG